MNKKTFCILPWVHTHLNTEGDVFPCCISWDTSRKARVGWIKDYTLEELFNNDFMKQLRLDMLNGVKREDVCSSCISREASGFSSPRQSYNNDFAHDVENVESITQPDGYVVPVIKSWDVRFSNQCNLKCRSCGTLFSSLWAQENKDNRNTITPVDFNVRDPLEHQYQNVEKIYFAGGEPLIMPEHFRTLQQLIDRGRADKIEIIYNSNMTVLNYNQHNLLDYWVKFKKITIGASIDAMGPRAEYIRHRIPWKNIEQNLRKLIEYTKEHNNIDFYYSPTVGILNIHHLCDMHQYLWNNNLMKYIDSILFNILLYPEHYNCRILPANIKDEISKKIDSHIDWLKANNASSNTIDQYTNLKVYLNEESDKADLLKVFYSKTIALDEKRNENLEKTFPEYAEMFTQLRAAHGTK